MRGFGSLTLALLAVLLQLSVARAQRCTAPLVAVGPVDPSHGFPKYYLDSNNLALQPCLDFVCDPALELPDPNIPVAFPDNFPPEFFYQRAIADMTGPNGETFLLVIALEGSFVNGEPINGDQFVFTRVRVRATGLVPGETYKVTHPFGVETLRADGPPPLVINFTRDIGTVPQAFGTVLNGDVGPFLTFLAGATPPPGTIGNPAGNQTVTGSACGTNFFKVEGPGLPGSGVRTDVFNTLIGKIAFICGNGMIDPGEQCDDGNIAAGDCCSPSCQFESAGAACEDGNPCTANSTCDGAGACQVGGFTTAACDDGNACTTGDRCDGTQAACVGGPAPDCDDGNVCTTDACDPTSGCVHTNNTAPCDDGNACTGPDACGGGACQSGPAVGCDDGNSCTSDSCDPQLGCQHANESLIACNDDNACTSLGVCLDGQCIGGPLISCDDGNPCTDDSCDGLLGCVHVSNTASCNDGNACTTDDHCSAGTCFGGLPRSCDDANPFTTDSCSPTAGCQHANVTDGAGCSDGNACTQTDTCQGGFCTGTNPVACAPLDQCHAPGTCDPQTGTCSNPQKPNGTACDDGSACTRTDTCSAGVCTGGNAVTCAAPDACHEAGTCDPQTGACSNPVKPDGAACNDGNACTQSDTCQAGVCKGTSPVVCGALDQCHTPGVCDPSSGTCSNPAKPNGVVCNDGLFCTVNDACSDGVCGGQQRNCTSAGDQCNDAVCDEAANRCVAQPKADGLACNDNNGCTQTDVCHAGVCEGSNPVVCVAPDSCHAAGPCQPSTGTCPHPALRNGTPCDDGNACTQTDTCNRGVCAGANPVTCSAADQCHDAGICDPTSGACSNPPKPDGTSCNDGSLCTQTDSCQAGTCTGGNPIVCGASDQCHDAGTCDPATGRCSNPAKPEGTACNDANPCTQTDTCRAGTCVGASPVACTASDQCHGAGTCDPLTGACSDPPKQNGTSCDDGNACTRSDGCQSGVCTGTNPVACAASDQCHDAGSCNPATGTCSNPAKPDGSTCGDGNPCTRTDTCESGVCTGANPLACPAPDDCHEAGTCDPATGACVYATKPDGAACNDRNACTQTDTCQAGVCRGASPVVCAASDQCHAVGVCDALTGTCSNPVKPDDTTCNDGNLCTRTDTCQAGVCRGSDPVVCTASDQCHDTGTCDVATGVCSNPAKADGAACDDGAFCTVGDVCTRGACQGAPRDCSTAADQCNDGICNEAADRCERSPLHDGTPCSDGDLCTQNDACQAGVCGGAPIVCSAQDQCHGVGVCDPSTGSCTNPVAEGVACDDGQFCTVDDTCRRGVCRGALRDCSALADQCNGGVCNEATSECERAPKRNGSICDDGDACTRADTCQGGSCTGHNPVVCAAPDQCHDAGTCDPGTGDCSNPAKPDGAACNDGDACTRLDACQAGACAGSDPVACAATDACHDAGTCDPRTGSCSNPAKPDGTACDDTSACTLGDACSQGACVGAEPANCDDGNPCTEDSCDAAGGCQHQALPDGSSCSDGDACTVGDTCLGGTCAARSRVACSPSDQCHAAGVCDPATGTCSNPARPDGSACSDGDPCTQNETCRAGTCSPGDAVVCVAPDLCHAAGVCDPTTGSCSSPEISCDDGDPCTLDGCLADTGCVHSASSGFASVTCVFAASHEAGLCPAETIPAAVTRASTDAQHLIDQAMAAKDPRQAQGLLRKAAKKLRSAAQLVSRAGRKKHISPACTAALRGLYLDGKARAETMARELKHKT